MLLGEQVEPEHGAEHRGRLHGDLAQVEHRAVRPEVPTDVERPRGIMPEMT